MNYGKEENESISSVIEIYKDINLQSIFTKEYDQLVEKIQQNIQNLNSFPKSALTRLLNFRLKRYQ